MAINPIVPEDLYAVLRMIQQNAENDDLPSVCDVSEQLQIVQEKISKYKQSLEKCEELSQTLSKFVRGKLTSCILALSMEIDSCSDPSQIEIFKERVELLENRGVVNDVIALKNKISSYEKRQNSSSSTHVSSSSTPLSLPPPYPSPSSFTSPPVSQHSSSSSTSFSAFSTPLSLPPPYPSPSSFTSPPVSQHSSSSSTSFSAFSTPLSLPPPYPSSSISSPSLSNDISFPFSIYIRGVRKQFQTREEMDKEVDALSKESYTKHEAIIFNSFGGLGGASFFTNALKKRGTRVYKAHDSLCYILPSIRNQTPLDGGVCNITYTNSVKEEIHTMDNPENPLSWTGRRIDDDREEIGKFSKFQLQQGTIRTSDKLIYRSPKILIASSTSQYCLIESDQGKKLLVLMQEKTLNDWTEVGEKPVTILAEILKDPSFLKASLPHLHPNALLFLLNMIVEQGIQMDLSEKNTVSGKNLCDMYSDNVEIVKCLQLIDPSLKTQT